MPKRLARQQSYGILFGKGYERGDGFGSRETIARNTIRAQTTAMELSSSFFDAQKNNKVIGNIIVKTKRAGSNWSASNLVLPSGNRVVEDANDKLRPRAPDGVRLRQYCGRAVIEWASGGVRDVMGYCIYKNSKRIPESGFRGAAFFIDISANVGDRYQVSAGDYSGKESKPSGEIAMQTALPD